MGVKMTQEHFEKREQPGESLEENSVLANIRLESLRRPASSGLDTDIGYSCKCKCSSTSSSNRLC